MGIPIRELVKFGTDNEDPSIYIDEESRALCLHIGSICIQLQAAEPGLQSMLDDWVETILEGPEPTSTPIYVTSATR